MKIRITKDRKEANCITHNGKFHCDEVFATVIFSKILPEVMVYRTNEIDNPSENAYVYDIGEGEFDHHQLGGNGERANGVKYASCGLAWKKFGRDIIAKYEAEEAEYVYEKMDVELFQGIDAVDNGQIPKSKEMYKINTLSDLIADFNPTWEESCKEDEQFLKAVNVAEMILDNKIKNIISKSKAKDQIEQAIENSADGILVLNKFLPWREFVLESKNEKASQINFVVFPSNREGYNIYTVPENGDTYESRKLFPEKWAGLRGQKLQEVTGVKTAKFCHNGRFICVTATKEDAIKLAKIANQI